MGLILVNWCQGWFDFFPEAPLGVLKIVDSLLVRHDKQLLAHFKRVGVTAEVNVHFILLKLFNFFLLLYGV